MNSSSSPWDDKILASLRPGSVTFAWDDGEIRTIPAPKGALDNMKSAWAWIDTAKKDLESKKGRPRSICFRLSSGEFRGLKFPDWNPGVMED